MPEVQLMRHAKSVRDAPVPRDRDRPLAPRGEAAAAAMGVALARMGVAPGHVMTSPAVRAEMTARIAADVGGWDAEIEVVDALYGGGTNAVIAAMAAAPGVERLMLVGHEPTWSDAVATLVGGGAHAMVTAAVACIEVSSLSRPVRGSLLWLLTPRLLTDGDLQIT
jgi:phosphohistidine phosphatase